MSLRYNALVRSSAAALLPSSIVIFTMVHLLLRSSVPSATFAAQSSYLQPSEGGCAWLLPLGNVQQNSSIPLKELKCVFEQLAFHRDNGHLPSRCACT
jgi:hypothetical protein